MFETVCSAVRRLKSLESCLQWNYYNYHYHWLLLISLPTIPAVLLPLTASNIFCQTCHRISLSLALLSSFSTPLFPMVCFTKMLEPANFQLYTKSCSCCTRPWYMTTSSVSQLYITATITINQSVSTSLPS